jgi:hypothetical protein
LIKRYLNKKGKPINYGEQIGIDWLQDISKYQNFPDVVSKMAEAYARYFLNDDSLKEILISYKNNQASSGDPTAWLIWGNQKKLLPMLEKSVAGLKTMKPEERVKELAILSEYQNLFRTVYSRSCLPETEQKKLRDWMTNKINKPLAQVIQSCLGGTDDVAECLALGRAMGFGLYAEDLKYSIKPMAVMGFDPIDARIKAAFLNKPDRYGNVTSLSRLFVDYYRVAYLGDPAIYQMHAVSGEQDHEEKFRTFNRNAIGVYLGVLDTVSNLDVDPEYLRLLMAQFNMGLIHESYRKAVGPNPKVWGEHFGLYLSIAGGQPEGSTPEEYLRFKVGYVKGVLHGYRRANLVTDKEETVKGMMILLEDHLTYKWLVKRGIKNLESHKAHKLLRTRRYKRDIDKEMASAWKSFEDGLRTTLRPAYETTNVMKMIAAKPPAK